MKSRYTGDRAEQDVVRVSILANAMVATDNMEKRKRYAAAIEAMADAYVEKVEGSIENVYDVDITRKSTATVVADSEDEARAKAVAGLGIHDGEAVTAEVQK